ncbi:MAG: EB domain-containing protein [Thermomicrobiales bacterium]
MGARRDCDGADGPLLEGYLVSAGRAAAPSSSPVGRTRRRVVAALAGLPFLAPAAARALQEAAPEATDDNCARACRKKHDGKARKRCKRRCAAGRVCVPPGERGCDVPGGSCCDGACQSDVCVCPEGSIPVNGVCTRCTVCFAGGCQFNNLQTALDAVAPGSLVTLCPGSYTQLIEIGRITKSLTLWGAGAGKTVLSATSRSGEEQDLRGLTIPNAMDTVEIRNLTITGTHTAPLGVSANHGGIMNWATLRLYGVEVTRNSTTARGGGIVNNGTLTLGAGTRVTQNSGYIRGGGVLNYGKVIREAGSEVARNHPGQCVDEWTGSGCAG